jgi:hypothetical protein
MGPKNKSSANDEVKFDAGKIQRRPQQSRARFKEKKQRLGQR